MLSKSFRQFQVIRQSNLLFLRRSSSRLCLLWHQRQVRNLMLQVCKMRYGPSQSLFSPMNLSAPNPAAQLKPPIHVKHSMFPVLDFHLRQVFMQAITNYAAWGAHLLVRLLKLLFKQLHFVHEGFLTLLSHYRVQHAHQLQTHTIPHFNGHSHCQSPPSAFSDSHS